MHSLSEAMTDLAEDNMKLAQQRGVRGYAASGMLDAESVVGRRKREQEVAEARKRAEELEAAAVRREQQLKDLQAKLKREEAQRQAYVESNALYERKVMELEEKMHDSLLKEASRRNAAELIAKRLKQRVKDLEFLVSELQAAEEEDEDEDEDDSESASDTDDKPSSPIAAEQPAIVETAQQATETTTSSSSPPPPTATVKTDSGDEDKDEESCTQRKQ